MIAAQLEFPLIAIHFPVGIRKLSVKRQRHPDPEPHPDPVILAGVLVAENISFITFAVLLAIHRHKAPMPIASIARSTGYSYHAVRSQLLNNIYFDNLRPSATNPLSSGALNEEAFLKLARIEKRLHSSP